jgi:hypothetical protein
MYEKVKELKRWQDKLGKRKFWMYARGLTGHSGRLIEKMKMADINYIVEMFEGEFGKKITEGLEKGVNTADTL